MTAGDEAAAFLQIRDAEATDKNGILHCLRTAFEAYRDQYTPAGFADPVLGEHRLKRRFREMFLSVAVCDDKIVGTLGYKVCGGEDHCGEWPCCRQQVGGCKCSDFSKVSPTWQCED
jgi:hypothetical protein